MQTPANVSLKGGINMTIKEAIGLFLQHLKATVKKNSINL
jgi:hypothetical protein